MLFLLAFGLPVCALAYPTSDGEELAICANVFDEAREISASDLICLRDIGGAVGEISVAPDETHVAYQIQQPAAGGGDYVTKWFVAPISTNGEERALLVDDGGDVLLMHSGGRIDVKARWSPDSQWIAYRKKENDQIQLWRARRDGTVREQLTNNAADVLDFRWSQDGTRILFEVGRSREAEKEALQREGENGYLFDDRFELGSASLAPLRARESIYRRSAEGHIEGVWTIHLGAERERPARKEDVIEYRGFTEAPTLVHKQADPQRIRRVVYSDTSASVGWLQKETPANPREGWAYSVSMASDAGDETRCKAAQCKGWISAAPIWSEDGSEIFFVRREGQKGFTNALYGWNIRTDVVRTILKTDDKLWSCQRAAHMLVCLHEGTSSPRKIVAVHLEDGSMHTLVDPNPGFQSIKLTQVDTLEWREKHSETVAGGHLVYPVGYEPGKRYPLVIVQYVSQGFLRGGVGNEFPIHPLAAQGFFVLSFDRPVNPRALSSKDLWERERAEWGEDLWERSATLSALEVIVDTLTERGLIDPDRVGITGLSDGAETVWYSMMYSSHFSAAAVSSGGWSPSIYFLGNSSFRRYSLNRAAELFQPGGDSDERWKRVSPEFHASTIDVPILVQVSDSELVVSAATIASLLDAGKPIETYVFPREFHTKWRPKHKLSVYERTIDWFNFWLRGLENNDPNRRDQYERWRNLRELHISNLEAAGKEYALPIRTQGKTATSETQID